MYIPLSVIGLLFSLSVISDLGIIFNQRRLNVDKSAIERNSIAVFIYQGIICNLSIIIMIFFIYLTYKAVGFWVILIFFLLFITCWIPRKIILSISGSFVTLFIFTHIYILIELGLAIYLILK